MEWCRRSNVHTLRQGLLHVGKFDSSMGYTVYEIQCKLVTLNTNHAVPNVNHPTNINDTVL